MLAQVLPRGACDVMVVRMFLETRNVMLVHVLLM